MRLGKGKVKDLLEELDEMTLEAAAEVIAKDLRGIDLKRFVRALLECCPIECIAKAVVKAED
ncbi:MAG: hypothetical protein F7C37_06890 [Desulfurococcales archaeon]|nr:hypothetical protein [Desulfurococcales archaeon]